MSLTPTRSVAVCITGEMRTASCEATSSGMTAAEAFHSRVLRRLNGRKDIFAVLDFPTHRSAIEALAHITATLAPVNITLVDAAAESAAHREYAESRRRARLPAANPWVRCGAYPAYRVRCTSGFF